MKENKKSIADAIAFPVRKVRSFWLFGKQFKPLDGKKKALYIAFNAAVMLVFALLLGVMSLRLAYGEAYSKAIFGSYFENGYIVTLNLLPPVLLMILFFGITGISWLAFLLDAVVTLGFTFGNFFLLRFRDDPLMFTDLLYIKEAASISKEGYDYTPTPGIVVCIIACVLMTAFLFFFCRARMNIFVRFAVIALPIICIFPLKSIYFDTVIYDQKTKNIEHINQWSSTQVYVSKGFVYPFIHSISLAVDTPPLNYSEKEAKEILDGFKTEYVPDEKKVHVIAIMLEAFCDLETMGVEGINPNVYAAYRKIRDENLSGTLITNIFAGGTVDSERAFLTGYADLKNYRRDVNSYVRSFNEMGYYTTGCHPSDDWFYNRKNINRYMGFHNYLFKENYFYEKHGDNMRLDSNAFPEFYNNFEQSTSQSDKPYFAFHVTYQGHGPYASSGYEWGNGTYYHNDNLSEAYNHIIDNYLGSLRDTGYQLEWFINKIKESDEPCVVLLYGDHKPWLGDANSVYNALGVNLDKSTAEGFKNYYGTEYVIVANDKAKEVVGNDFTGKGPMTSPCMLMSVLFDNLGIKGNEFMQFQRQVREVLPALNLVGGFDKDGNYYTLGGMPESIAQVYNRYMRVAYYKSTVFDK